MRSGSPVMSVPSMSTLPLVGWSRPARIRSRVDLPQPDSPTMPKRSPGATSKLTPRSADTTGPGLGSEVRGRR